MLKATYDYQSSHPGYIDMEFKEIHIVEDCKYPIDSWESLFELISEGYFIDEDIDYPDFIGEIFEWDGNFKLSGISKRLVKKWCKDFFKKYGNNT